MCCSVFRCFGWILDILQRILTFALGMILCCALCIGVIVALGAGIAYGYNMSLAEYLEFKKADVTVYVRRGQFGDQPVFKPGSRRSMGNDPDLFASNYSVDYQDHKLPDNSEPLSDVWKKAQDSSNYADKLMKFTETKPQVLRTFTQTEKTEEELAVEEPPSNGDGPVSFVNSAQLKTNQSTTSGDQVMMRHFLPEYRPTYPDEETQDDEEPRRGKRRPKKKKTGALIAVKESQSNAEPKEPNFLYAREDFEDNEKEIKTKPV